MSSLMAVACASLIIPATLYAALRSSKAETDQADYRRTEPVNVFFGPVKNIGTYQCSVLVFNTVVLLGFTGLCLALVHISLRRQLSTKA